MSRRNQSDKNAGKPRMDSNDDKDTQRGQMAGGCVNANRETMHTHNVTAPEGRTSSSRMSMENQQGNTIRIKIKNGPPNAKPTHIHGDQEDTTHDQPRMQGNAHRRYAPDDVPTTSNRDGTTRRSATP